MQKHTIACFLVLPLTDEDIRRKNPIQRLFPYANYFPTAVLESLGLCPVLLGVLLVPVMGVVFNDKIERTNDDVYVACLSARKDLMVLQVDGHEAHQFVSQDQFLPGSRPK